MRVPLHGRRVRGWVVELDPVGGPTTALRPIAQVSSRGPAPELIDLARWASVRWGATRLRPFLVTASPPNNVAGLPPPRRTARPIAPVHAGAAELLRTGGGMLRLPPTDDVIPVLAAAFVHGPTLVVVPSNERARLDAIRLRRAGLTVAIVPDEWAAAAGGVDVVIGARAAAWAPCPDLATVVVVDEHDEALQEERSPTWHARDVAVERARRRGARVLLVSPCPTVVGLARVDDRLWRPAIDDERAGWPFVEVVDRGRDEPWKTSLVTSQLIAHLRTPDRTVVCVHNTPGRARILACRTCRTLARCARCEAAVALADDGTLACPRCDLVRPPVCRECGGTAFRNLRPGITRLREELEAAAGRPVVAVSGADADDPPPAQRVRRHGGRAAPRAPGRRRRLPRHRHRVAGTALSRRRAGDGPDRARGAARRIPGRWWAGAAADVPAGSRGGQVGAAGRPGAAGGAGDGAPPALSLPPFAALAAISGSGGQELRRCAADGPRPARGGGPGDVSLVRAPSWDELGQALITTPRPKGSRLRIEVDPARR